MLEERASLYYPYRIGQLSFMERLPCDQIGLLHVMMNSYFSGSVLTENPTSEEIASAVIMKKKDVKKVWDLDDEEDKELLVGSWLKCKTYIDKAMEYKTKRSEIAAQSGSKGGKSTSELFKGNELSDSDVKSLNPNQTIMYRAFKDTLVGRKIFDQDMQNVQRLLDSGIELEYMVEKLVKYKSSVKTEKYFGPYKWLEKFEQDITKEKNNVK